VRDGLYFVDEQRVGPYEIWHHEHHFHDLGDGRIETEDKVTYTLPFSPFSEVVHPFLVKPQLDKIFAFREKKVTELFGA
jgi:ligand-binding SRPBCC domain-containing protein